MLLDSIIISEGIRNKLFGVPSPSKPFFHGMYSNVFEKTMEFYLQYKYKKDMKDHSFTLVVDDLPLEVTAVPFQYNTETRFKVSYNNSPEVVFTWDSSLGRLAPLGDEAAAMPDSIEVAIAEKIQSGNF